MSINDIDKFKSLDGQIVQLEGKLHREFEDVALYPVTRAGSEKAIWLALRIPDSIPLVRLDSLNYKNIIIFGRLDFSQKGHLGAYLCTLVNINCMKAL